MITFIVNYIKNDYKIFPVNTDPSPPVGGYPSPLVELEEVSLNEGVGMRSELE